MKEAMEQVKAELGSEAVILHTKKYREGGFLGLKSHEIVEVTAALEDQPENKRPRRRREPVGQPVKPIVPPSILNQYKTSGTDKRLDIVSRPQDPVPAPEKPLPHASESAAAAAPTPAPAVTTLAVPTGTAAPAETTARLATGSGNSEDEQKIKQLEDELAQMKTLLAQVMSKDQPADEVTLQEALRRQDIDESVLEDMAAKMPAGATLRDCLDPEARAALVKYLGGALRFDGQMKIGRDGALVVALIGPTGVGKTTTLAKIAARFVLEKGIKAALITADTYRISAVEQLKTYSDIIGLPLEIVYTPDELRVAIHKHRDKDLVLIDTAGRSQHNERQMQELEDLLAVNNSIKKYLVLSATTKTRDAADILEKFSACKPDDVIFTKTDETMANGLIVNLLAGKETGLAFLTNGQSVPDDIVPATPENLADLLLRE